MNHTSRKKRLPIILGALGVVLILALAASAIYLRQYPTSAAFRSKLTAALGKTLHAQVDMLPINWQDSALASDGLHITGNGPSRIKQLTATSLHTQPRWRALMSKKLHLELVQADTIELKMKSPSGSAPPADPGGRGLPLTIDRFQADRFSLALPLTAGMVNVQQTRLSGKRTPGYLTLEAVGGLFDMGPGMHYSLNRLATTRQMGSWYIDELDLGDVGQSRLKASGQFDEAQGLPGHIKAEFKHLALSRLFHSLNLPLEAGTVSGSTTLKGPLARPLDLRMQGVASFDQDLTQLFPVMEKFFKFTPGNHSLRSSCRAEFRYHAGKLQFENIDANYLDQLLVRGKVSVSTEQVAGRVRLGLTTPLLNQLPQPVQQLFPQDADGRFWTTVRLSGSPSRPLEDLSARVLKQLAEQAPKALEENVVPTIDAAGELMRQLILPWKQRGF